ncbi:MAG: photosynthetic complex putative assembly protein PuhB, partial [Acidocella sp.]|nr:photosynthetic complex putative assembly protein PuhB [Acidocella sp.]
MSRFKGRPMDGLPGRLPEGEVVLWQAKPAWRAMARETFRIRLVAVYFAALVVWRVAGSMQAGHDLHYALISAASCMILGAAGVSLFCLFAWLIARTTTYTITQKRVVITYGMALPKSLNLPFTAIDAANLRLNADGTGN